MCSKYTHCVQATLRGNIQRSGVETVHFSSHDWVEISRQVHVPAVMSPRGRISDGHYTGSGVDSQVSLDVVTKGKFCPC